MRQKKFPENPALSRTTSYRFLALCQNSEKTMIHFQENTGTEGWTEGQTERQKDGQILFYRTLPTTTRGLINYFNLENFASFSVKL